MKDKRKISLSSLGETKEPEHELQYDWSEDGKDISVQGGCKGLVLSKEKTRTTAFFEAFPRNPSCFIRGEGSDIAAAETAAWEKYQKILTCDHEMERRKRTDGYGYCKHCSYSAMVFEPLTKCCKCGIPTSYDSDFRGKWYCKKHSVNKPKNPNRPKYGWDRYDDRRIPRKLKKKLKEAFRHDLYYRGVIVKLSEIKLEKRWFKLTTPTRSTRFSGTIQIGKYTRAVLRNKKAYVAFRRQRNLKLYV